MASSKAPAPASASAQPPFWAAACEHLMKKDRVMRRLIPQFGQTALESRGDAFVTLARSIVGQQISVKAAQTVWDRFALLPKKYEQVSGKHRISFSSHARAHTYTRTHTTKYSV
jgi:DNA-3-methyladenine glycosylase II